jgi:hypothetical protein
VDSLDQLKELEEENEVLAVGYFTAFEVGVWIAVFPV